MLCYGRDSTHRLNERSSSNREAEVDRYVFKNYAKWLKKWHQKIPQAYVKRKNRIITWNMEVGNSDVPKFIYFIS